MCLARAATRTRSARSGRESDRLRRGRLRRGRRRQPRLRSRRRAGSFRERQEVRVVVLRVVPGIAEGHRAVGVPDHVVRQARHIRGEHDRSSGDAALGVVRGVHHRGEVVQARQVFHRQARGECRGGLRGGQPHAPHRKAVRGVSRARVPRRLHAVRHQHGALQLVHRLRAALDADHLNNLRLEQRAALVVGDDGVRHRRLPRLRRQRAFGLLLLRVRRGAHHRALHAVDRALVRLGQRRAYVEGRHGGGRVGSAGRRRGGETRAFRRRPGRRRESGGLTCERSRGVRRDLALD